MRKILLFTLLVVTLLFVGTTRVEALGNGTNVYVNGYELTPQQLDQFENYYGQLQPGYYWQDSSGHFGSGTGVYVNGYLLTPSLLRQFQQYYGYLQPGYYRLDAYRRLEPIYEPTPVEPLPVLNGVPGPNRDRSYGPFATIRRAQEVVNILRNMGYPNTIQYHNGDGQYVFPRR